MNPTPTEAEMREAKAWAIANTSDVASFSIATDAYAAALAKCRVGRGQAWKVKFKSLGAGVYEVSASEPKKFTEKP